MKNRMLMLIRKPFIRNVVTLSSGTALAQGVNMLFSPIITRQYGPEAYGLMGTFAAMVSMIAPVAALAYPISIVLPRSDDESKAIIKLSLLVTIINTAIVTLLLLMFDKEIFNLFKLEDISAFSYLIPFVILSAGILQIMEQWLIRKKRFELSARSTLIQSIVVNGGKVAVGIFYPLSTVLILFTALKSGIKALLIIVLSKKNTSFKKWSLISEEIKNLEVAKKYRDFPLFRAPQAFLNALSGNVPLLLLTGLFGPVSAGFYSIGRTVLGVPSQLIGKSVADVFYPRVSEAVNRGENISFLIKKATFYLSLVGIIPYGIIVIFGPWLFSLIFGQEWVMAGEYARWIAIWIYSDFVRMPSIYTLMVLSEQRFLLVYTSFMLFVQIASLLIGYYLFTSDIASIILFSIIGTALNICLVLTTVNKSIDYNKY